MEDDEPETVEFAPPADPLGPNLPPEDPNPYLAGLAAGGVSARQSIAAKWSEARKQPSWSDSSQPAEVQPEPQFVEGPAGPGQPAPQRGFVGTPPPAGRGPSLAGQPLPSQSAAYSMPTGAVGPAASGAWSSSMELRAPSAGPRAMTGPTSDAFGEFGDLDSYFEVAEDDGPDLLWIGVVLLSVLLLAVVLLLVSKGTPTVPGEVRRQPGVAQGVAIRPTRSDGAGTTKAADPAQGSAGGAGGPADSKAGTAGTTKDSGGAAASSGCAPRPTSSRDATPRPTGCSSAAPPAASQPPTPCHPGSAPTPSASSPKGSDR